MKLSRIDLERVHVMPKKLRTGVLYVSVEFGTAAHLCACGCGEKVRTPLGPTEWTFTYSCEGPTLYPSIGNWQQACQSHYWIREGRVIWAEKWTSEQIEVGQQKEQLRRQEYYECMYGMRGGVFIKLWRWILRLFRG